MSIKVTTAVWERSSSRLADRLILLYIADCCNHDGSGAYPGIQRLAESCGLSQSGVYAGIKRLCEMGELTVFTNKDRKKMSVYTINVDALGQSPSPNHSTFQDLEFQGLDESLQGLDESLQGLEKTKGDTSKEPSFDPSFDPSAKKSRKPSDALPDFALFYQPYPKHEGVSQARVTWGKLTKDQRVNAIKVLHHWLKAKKFSDDPKFVALPSTWLNKYAADEVDDPKTSVVETTTRLEQLEARLALCDHPESWPDDWKQEDHRNTILGKPKGLFALERRELIFAAIAEEKRKQEHGDAR